MFGAGARSLTVEAVDQGGQGRHPLDAPLLSPLPSQRGPAAPRGDRLQPWQSAAPAGPAARHPELVADELAAAAVQDRRAALPSTPVLPSVLPPNLPETPLQNTAFSKCPMV